MKRSLNKKNNLVIGTIALAVVSLTSIGFATWIAGEGVTNANASTSINIGVTTNKTILSEIEYGSYSNGTFTEDSNITKVNPLDIANSKDVNIDGTQSISDDSSAYSLGITPFRIKLIVSNDLNDLTKDNITFSSNIATTYNGSNSSTGTFNSKSVTTATTDSFGRTSGTYNYLYLKYTDDSISISNETSNIDGYKIYYVTVPSLSVGFGSYFYIDGTECTPGKFYNTKLVASYDAYKNSTASEKDTKLESYLSLLNEAKTELNAFRNAFNNQTIDLNFNISLDAKKSS